MEITPPAAVCVRTSSSKIKIRAHVLAVRKRSGFVVMSIDEEARESTYLAMGQISQV